MIEKENIMQNDIDCWTNALSKCHLDTAILPTSRGYLIEHVDCYNKIQAILNSPAMEHCHKYLYNLDIEELQEDEIKKVDELYKLGQDRGFIPQTTDFDTDEKSDIDNAVAAQDMTEPAVQPPQETKPIVTAPIASYTVMYSAMKDGQIKTGEAYSNSISPRAAKADVLAKLSQIGYDNISILAIEATDPDCVSTTAQTQTQPNINQIGVALADANNVNEADKKDADNKADDEQSDSDSNDEQTDNDQPEEKNSLSANEKQTLKDQYKQTFKDAMFACKFDGMKFNDLTLEQKVELLTKLKEKWNEKPDSTEFMTQEDTEKLNNTVMKG